MIVRLAFWACKQAQWGNDKKLFESSAVPLMQAHPGFIQAKLLGKKKDTERIAFTVWEDEASYEAFLASDAFRDITEMFAPMYVDGSLPQGQTYEVRASSQELRQ